MNNLSQYVIEGKKSIGRGLIYLVNGLLEFKMFPVLIKSLYLPDEAEKELELISSGRNPYED